ncbi:hypothetical protein [Gimesia sp.]|uniref:amino acid kinase family protein n=1 Tax=Gimesia sp. TaxID=2024833 RepID=UPI0032F02333
MPVTVIKVGGSLFDLPDLKDRLVNLLSELKDSQPLLLAGGGQEANLVRDRDRIYDLPQGNWHSLAIQAMLLNNSLLCYLLPDARLVLNIREAEHLWRVGLTPVLSINDYLVDTQSEEYADLPTSWDVTSDSIAAWITLTWPADELVLLKSVDLPNTVTTDDLSAQELVDPYFPKLADSLPCLRWCNLRSSEETLQLATVTRGSSFQSRNATGPA